MTTIISSRDCDNSPKNRLVQDPAIAIEQGDLRELDRFGVSWQIVPDFVLAIDEGPDRAAAERLNVAILQMTKLDRERLRRSADHSL